MYRPAVRPKALWVQAQNRPPVIKRRNRIPQMSKHRHSRMVEYRRVVAELKQERPFCEVPGCGKNGQDPHHTRGRAGPLLTDKRHMRHICRDHHNRVKEDYNWAVSVGMLCERGKWNVPDRT